jgi:uracil-DNA glycosylase family 4
VTPNKLPLLQGILDGNPSPEIDTLFPFVPLNAPDMPLPGPNFCRMATAMGAAPQITGKGKTTELVDPGRYLHYLYRRALYDRRFAMQMFHKGVWLQSNYLTGHPLNAAGSPSMDDEDTENAFGPRPSDVMVVGKHPGREELSQLRLFCGPGSEDLYKAFGDLGLAEADYGDWYVTNAMRFGHLDPNAGSIPADWLKDCAPLLHQELRLVRPKFILCFGAEAIKAVLGKAHTITTIAGRVIQLTYPVHNQGERPEVHTVPRDGYAPSQRRVPSSRAVRRIRHAVGAVLAVGQRRRSQCGRKRY